MAFHRQKWWITINQDSFFDVSSCTWKTGLRSPEVISLEILNKYKKWFCFGLGRPQKWKCQYVEDNTSIQFATCIPNPILSLLKLLHNMWYNRNHIPLLSCSSFQEVRDCLFKKTLIAKSVGAKKLVKCSFSNFRVIQGAYLIKGERHNGVRSYR